MNKIHKTAIIEGNVKLGENVGIGAYSVLNGNIEIGDNVLIKSQVNIAGNTKIGKGTKIFPFASVGNEPQDLKYKGEEVFLEIGENNLIREHVTINPGTEGGGKLTKIGNNCLLMIGSHIAHDCVVGNNVILANNATLAGHVQVGDFAVIGGLSAIHQFVRIGAHAMIGGMSGIESDVIPYGSAFGERASLQGLNLVGLKRRNFSREIIHSIRGLFRNIFDEDGTLEEKIKRAESEFANVNEVREIIDFLKNAKDRAICQPKKT